MKQEILKIIEQGESEKLEFKKNFGDELIASLTAMANFKGGKVLLGVDNNGKIRGIKIAKESIQKWLNEIQNKTQPCLGANAYRLKIENKVIVIFEISEFPLKPVSFRNRYYLRKNNSNHILSLQEVAEMYLSTKNSSWDFYPDENSNLDTLDQDKITRLKLMIEENLNISLGDNLSFLRKYSLIVEKSNREYPSFASMLLFSKEPLMQTDIQIGLFQTDTIIKKSKVIANDLISEVEEVMDFIESY
ncbi:putative DNA binding domain-containing protein, partial [Candidatus Parcubacteria bacterium]|nr:putative DNA binding domain-containing protein [Candidatus Parcubacteria bacterium]